MSNTALLARPSQAHYGNFDLGRINRDSEMQPLTMIAYQNWRASQISVDLSRFNASSRAAG
jgi:hypothetical protein